MSFLMPRAYLNKIATAVPAHEVHGAFVAFAGQSLADRQQREIYLRMAARSGIRQRYSVLSAAATDGQLAGGLYRQGAFPTTAARMQLYRQHALSLVRQALDQLTLGDQRITHLLITSCTGFYAPGVDLDIIAHYGLSPSIERTQIGFMGCYAAINALKLARHIVCSDPAARVLIVNIELCTLHLQETDQIEDLLSFTIFADGCAASIVSSEPHGLELESFYATLLPATESYITWEIADAGFVMELSGKVAASLTAQLPSSLPQILGSGRMGEIALWAIHPGGRSILDAVEKACALPAAALGVSRDILARYGNMSSATIMFVLQRMLIDVGEAQGCAMAFGPGVMAETMLFRRLAK